MKLFEIFGNPHSTTDEINCALEAMELMDPLIDNVDAQNSYDLFHIIMQAPVSLAYPEEKKWRAACLAMNSAHKWKGLLQIDDHQNILTFLDHHFNLIARGHQDQERPVYNALLVLAKAPGLNTIQPRGFDLTKTSFIHGICYVFQGNQSLQLRTAALFFLPCLGDMWFNTPHPIMELNHMRSLCTDWASTVDDIEHTDDVQRVALAAFLEMINSPHWCPHIIRMKWKLLEYFTSLPDDSQPLRRRINNPRLMTTMRIMGNPAAMALWFAILWYKYKELTPQVQYQLGVVAVEFAQGGGADLNMCLSVIDSELRRFEGGLDQLTRYCNAVSIAPGATSASSMVEGKVKMLQDARTALVANS